MADEKTYRETAHVYLGAKDVTDRAAGSAAAAASVLAPVLLSSVACALFSACFTLPSLVAYGVAGGIVAAAGGVASVLIDRDRRLHLVAAVLAVASLGIMVVLPATRADLYAFCNAVIWHVDEVHGTLIELIAPGATVATTPLFGILLGVVTGALWWQLTRLRTTAPTLLAVTLCSASSVHLGLGHGVAVVIGIAGWLAHCRLAQLSHARTTWRALAVNLGSALALCLVLAGVCGVLYVPGGAVANLRESVVSAVDRIRFGNKVLPEGDLSRAADLNAKTDEHLDITVHGKPADDLLLRGYVGAMFKDGGWSPIDHTAYTGRWNGVVSWLSGRGFTPVRQRSLYDALRARDRDEEYGEYSIDVHADDTDRRYAFVPYSANAQDGPSSTVDADGSLRSVMWGDRGYSFDIDNVPAADVFDDTSWLAGAKGSYVQSERVYGAFAKSAYTKLDKREAAAVKRYIFNDDTWDASAATSTYAVISRVRTMLDTLASYTETPEAPKTGTTFTDWFLGEAREGNSAYFATVATLAFRSQGIPARYVEGYRATAKALTDAVKVGGNLRLDNSDLHAWCEVYVDGQGWTPVEVTPGFYAQALEADSVIDVSEAWSGGSDADALQAGSVMGNIDKDRKDKTVRSGVSVLDVALRVAGALVLTVIALAAVVVGERHARIRTCRARMASEDQSVCVPELYRVLSLVMKENLPGFDAARPLDGLDGFERVFKGIDRREYRRVVELHQAYAFGGRDLRADELRTVRRLTERMHAAMPKPAGFAAWFTRYAIDVL